MVESSVAVGGHSGIEKGWRWPCCGTQIVLPVREITVEYTG